MFLRFDLASGGDYRSKRKRQRFFKLSITALLLVVLLVPLGKWYLSTPTYTARVELEWVQDAQGSSPASKINDLAATTRMSTAEQILLSRGMFDKILKQHKLSELPEFDPILLGHSAAKWAVQYYSTIWAAESCFGAGPYLATPYERVLNSYRERLNVVADPGSHRILIEFRSANASLAEAVARSIADDFLVRADVGGSARIMGSATRRTNVELGTILDDTFVLILLAPLTLLLMKFDIVPWLWSLLWRFRGRTVAFSISILALWALGIWLNPPEYRSDAQVLLSAIPVNFDGKHLSLGDEIQAQIDLLRSDKFATFFLTTTNIANFKTADEKTRERVMRIWHQRLGVSTEDTSWVVSISYQSPNPQTSANVVSAVVNFFIRWRQELRKAAGISDLTNADEVISAALVSDTPVYPNRRVILGWAIILTTVGALVLFLATQVLGWRSQTKADAEIDARLSSFKATTIEKITVLLLVVVPFVANLIVQHSIRMSRDLSGALNLLVLLTWALGYGVLYLHLRRRRRIQVNLNTRAALLLENDREYFLYLRSFVTSKRLLVRNRLPGLLDRLLVGSFWDLEFALAYAFESVCPLVAIGLAGGGVGASKLSVPDHRWKEVFTETAQKARLIFIVPFATTGTLYEIMALAGDAALLRKTVWVMPPSYFGLRWSILFSVHGRRWEKVRKTLAASGIALPRYSRRGGLFILDNRGSPMKQISTDDFSEERMRPFAQSLIHAAGHQEQAAYEGHLNAIEFPRRNWRWYLSEWLFRRWLCDRLAGFSITALLTSFLIALVIRTFLFQPFNIPSGSMKPTLLVGDYLFVSKFDYGYTHYSLPFSPPLFSGRVFAEEPKRGDVAVFRLPKDDTTDYIKRIIGLPGDRIRMTDGLLYINGVPVERERMSDYIGEDPCGSLALARVKRWKERLPNGVSYETLDCIDNGFYDNTIEYVVPPGHYFMMGDNRDNSTDSRVLSAVGYVPFENLIGRAWMIYFSVREGESAFFIPRLPAAVRWKRIFEFVR